MKYWVIHNEQNLMMRVDERMNICETDPLKKEKIRAQMDYHMFLAHALATNACHEAVENGKSDQLFPVRLLILIPINRKMFGQRV